MDNSLFWGIALVKGPKHVIKNVYHITKCKYMQKVLSNFCSGRLATQKIEQLNFLSKCPWLAKVLSALCTQ